MPTGRRGFFKQLGGLLAGMTVAGRIKLDQEWKSAPPYVRKYMKNSIPPSKITQISHYATGVFCCSGTYIPTMCSGYINIPRNVSGSFAPDNPPILPPNSRE